MQIAEVLYVLEFSHAFSYSIDSIESCSLAKRELYFENHNL